MHCKSCGKMIISGARVIDGATYHGRCAKAAEERAAERRRDERAALPAEMRRDMPLDMRASVAHLAGFDPEATT